MPELDAWVIQLVTGLLSQTKIPQFLVNIIVAEITKELTAENLTKLKVDVECFICAHLKTVGGATPGPKTQMVLDGVEEMLGCANCKGATPVAPAAVTPAA
jgi:hypothetical protein